MVYKVFLVEDEIAAREGIRDNVDWQSVGFELSGEAPDGEIALPLIEAAQPDVLITDIRMPFMDGLQLSKIVRVHLPWVKIIIISGYDDFSYAQTALKLGVSEYLLKPVNVQDLETVLRKVAVVLGQEKRDREYLKLLRSQVEDNLVLLREKFLLRMVLGGESSISAIEQSEQLGLDLIAKCYLVILIKIVDGGQPPDYTICQQAEKKISDLVATIPGALLTKKDLEEFVLILKGETPEQIEQEGAFLAGLIRDEVQAGLACPVTAGVGKAQQRLGDLHRSFAEALARVRGAQSEPDTGELKKLDQSALLRYLETGTDAEFETFFDTHIRPLSEAAIRSQPLKQYFVIDILLTAAQFISNLGGNAAQVLPEIQQSDPLLANLQTLEQIRAETKRIFTTTLAFRDAQVNNDRAAIIQQAKAYIENHFADSNLSLNEVATQVNFSPNHFSAVFSAETGETFRDYLARNRIEQAKKLLRTTRLKCSEVAMQCGYNDPHYFSIIFRRNTGVTPQRFRDISRKQR